MLCQVELAEDVVFAEKGELASDYLWELTETH
jgi:hypothetical protein